MICCVEDDKSIRELIIYALNNEGYDAMGFGDYGEFKSTLYSSSIDLIILDIMLPGKSGLEILKEIRNNEKTKNIPVMMLTAKTTEYDKIVGLDSGADDYMIKPFSIMELLARVRALLRRSSLSKTKSKIIYKNIELDYDKRTVNVDGENVELTYKEFELLYYLLSNVGKVLTRENIMTKIWGFDFEGESRTVDVHIATLRQKLKNASSIIKTIRNLGYKAGEWWKEKFTLEFLLSL